MQANGAEVNMHADNLYANGNFETLPQGVVGCTLDSTKSFMGNKSIKITPDALGKIPIGSTNSKGVMVSFMYWMGRTNFGESEGNIKVKVKYRDGTEETGDEIELNAEADCWQPMIIPIGKNYINLFSEIDYIELIIEVSYCDCYIDFLRVIENEFVIIKSEED